MLSSEQIDDQEYEDEEFGSLVGLLRKGMEPEDEEDEVRLRAEDDSDNDSRREDIEGSNHGHGSESSDSNKRYRDKFIIQTLVVPGHTIKHQSMLPTRNNFNNRRPYMSMDFSGNRNNHRNGNLLYVIGERTYDSELTVDNISVEEFDEFGVDKKDKGAVKLHKQK